MSDRGKWLLIALISFLALGGAGVIGVVAWQQHQERQSAPSSVETASPTSWATGDRIVFRNTAPGQGYGHVTSVPYADPYGPRAVTARACDRVDATASEFMCLKTDRGIAPSYSATLYASDGSEMARWPLPGIPSRTRISLDGTRIATTSFVTGHSYATIGFSTETVIRSNTGESFGNLEEWTFLIDDAPASPTDRNFWGVTFIDDGAFYATASTGGVTYLVKGDIDARSLTAVVEGVECPSLSPDGTRIAYKHVTAGAGLTAHWTPAILELASGGIELLPETRSIDDQIEWLDDDTILYGMPRDGAAGDSDVWALSADGSGDPEVLIKHAWSPSVVRQ